MSSQLEFRKELLARMEANGRSDSPIAKGLREQIANEERHIKHPPLEYYSVGLRGTRSTKK